MIVPDETGWRVGGEGAWLWVAATRGATAYWVADGRGFDQACEVISLEFSGVMVRDGWAPYRRFDNATAPNMFGSPLSSKRRAHRRPARLGGTRLARCERS